MLCGWRSGGVHGRVAGGCRGEGREGRDGEGRFGHHHRRSEVSSAVVRGIRQWIGRGGCRVRSGFVCLATTQPPSLYSSPSSSLPGPAVSMSTVPNLQSPSPKDRKNTREADRLQDEKAEGRSKSKSSCLSVCRLDVPARLARKGTSNLHTTPPFPPALSWTLLIHSRLTIRDTCQILTPIIRVRRDRDRDRDARERHRMRRVRCPKR